MNDRVDHVLLQAMTLAPEERSLIALSLLDSIQGSGDTDDAVVASWVAEAHTRHQALVAGHAQGLTGEEFRAWFRSL
jgi:hypothetical protein